MRADVLRTQASRLVQQADSLRHATRAFFQAGKFEHGIDVVGRDLEDAEIALACAFDLAVGFV